MNSIQLVGRLVRAVELQYTATGRAYARFTVAVSRPHDKDKTDFIPCIIWGQSAQSTAKYVHKGNRVGIIGELHQNDYVTKDGEKKQSFQVRADQVEFLTPATSQEPDVQSAAGTSGAGTTPELDCEQSAPLDPSTPAETSPGAQSQPEPANQVSQHHEADEQPAVPEDREETGPEDYDHFDITEDDILF
ncbi:single-stranded DNA-binding protein [Lacticaseibacillus suibinensis]|uniref:single-stranded DNA-binding protein n=1 Tax=Lacticaseibacillus suibinensis TaxID=2486011 RepID=UPI000F78AAD3|nr:single-stranded DNA-binding protein [Lacticaseibacillus suibinensis]